MQTHKLEQIYITKSLKISHYWRIMAELIAQAIFKDTNLWGQRKHVQFQYEEDAGAYVQNYTACFFFLTRT